MKHENPTISDARIYLERVDADRRMARFYCVRIEPTLFGEWALMCHWGRIGCKGQLREQWLATWPEARQAQDQQIARKMRRGYGRRAAHAAP